MQLNTKQILQIMGINKQYEQILQPDVFVKGFKDLAEFRRWAEEGSIIDLKEAISVFQNYELYEHCAVMQKLIDDLL